MLSKFNQSPVLAIEAIGILPELKTTALGAVATGSINANEAVTAQANISVKESIPKLLPNEAKTGMSTEAVATLDVSSVMKFTAATRKTRIKNGGTDSKNRNLPANHSANPED